MFLRFFQSCYNPIGKQRGFKQKATSYATFCLIVYFFTNECDELFGQFWTPAGGAFSKLKLKPHLHSYVVPPTVPISIQV